MAKNPKPLRRFKKLFHSSLDMTPTYVNIILDDKSIPEDMVRAEFYKMLGGKMVLQSSVVLPREDPPIG